MDQVKLSNVAAGYFRSQPVIKEVDLALCAGDFLAVIGPNGCGKSTLIRAIAGVVPQWSGEVLIGGIDVAQMSRRDMARFTAVVPQETLPTIAFECGN